MVEITEMKTTNILHNNTDTSKPLISPKDPPPHGDQTLTIKTIGGLHIR
jgi:hypothetical protein